MQYNMWKRVSPSNPMSSHPHSLSFALKHSKSVGCTPNTAAKLSLPVFSQVSVSRLLDALPSLRGPSSLFLRDREGGWWCHEQPERGEIWVHCTVMSRLEYCWIIIGCNGTWIVLACTVCLGVLEIFDEVSRIVRDRCVQCPIYN